MKKLRYSLILFIYSPFFVIAQVLWHKHPNKNNLSVLITTATTSPFEIRSIKAEDIPVLAEKIYSDPETMQHFEAGKPYRPEETKALYMQTLKAMKDGNPCPPDTMLGIYQKNNPSTIIGTIGLYEADQKVAPGYLEIGYILQKSFWKQGYMTQAVAIMLAEYLPSLQKGNFKCSHAKGIIATASPENEGSVKVLQKAGFQFMPKNFFSNTELKFFTYKGVTGTADVRYGKTKWFFIRSISQ